MITLYDHQKKLIALRPKRHLLAWKVGTGKSLAALGTVKEHGGSTLVICTKTLKQAYKWEKEWSMINDDGQPHDPPVKGPALSVMSKEEFRRDYKKIDGFDNIIVDEAHMGFANVKAQLHKALLAYIKVHAPQCVLLLTGTPYTSTPMSVYGLARLLDFKIDYWRFRDKFFTPKHLGQRVIFEPRVGIENELADVVRQFGSVVRLEDCIDVPEQTVIHEEFPMSKEQEKAIHEMHLKETNPLTRFGKSHQIAQGVLKGNEYEDLKTFECEKNKRVLELAEQEGKIIVVSKYNAHIDALQAMLEEAGIPTLVLNGATKNRGEMMELAERVKRVVLLVQAECVEGWEAPSFDVMVFASLSYSYTKFEQAKGRLLRINNPKPNVYIILTTKDSMDEPVREAMDEKRDFSEAIFVRQHFPEYTES